MPVKDLHAASFDEGTLVKLGLFQDYLEEWLPVFIQNGSQVINIIDFFAGTGTDIEGKPGSPLLALDTIEKHVGSLLRKGLSVNLILNDFEVRKVESLKEAVKERLLRFPNLQKAVEVTYYMEDFRNLFFTLAPIIKNGPNLIFIDQNGIKQVREDVIQKLNSFRRTDFLFFISSSYFIRFSFEEIFPGLQKSLDLSKPSNIHREILSYYRGMLPNESGLKLYPFTIKKAGGYYGLIFGSQHCLGVQKFLNICWGKNEINGEANFDIDEEYKQKQPCLWGEKKVTKLEQFALDLEGYIYEMRKVTNKDILEFTLARGFIPKHASYIMKRLKDERKVGHFSYTSIGCKQVYRDNKIVFFRRLN